MSALSPLYRQCRVEAHSPDTVLWYESAQKIGKVKYNFEAIHQRIVMNSGNCFFSDFSPIPEGIN